MVHPRHRESSSVDPATAAFFAEVGEPVPNRDHALLPGIKWKDGARRRKSIGGFLVTIWEGEFPGAPNTAAHVKRIHFSNVLRPRYRWVVVCPELRIDGYAKSKKEAFGMAERAARSFPWWLQQIKEYRAADEPALTPEEERAFKAIDLLVGARPRYTPIRGSRAWSLRDEDIPKERTADWERHGHTVCCMLRDLIK